MEYKDEWFVCSKEEKEARALFRDKINPKPMGAEREQLLKEIQMRPGGRLWFEQQKNNGGNPMKKSYTIEIRYNGKELEGFKDCTFTVEKDNYNDIVSLVDSISTDLHDIAWTFIEEETSEVTFKGLLRQRCFI